MHMLIRNDIILRTCQWISKMIGFMCNVVPAMWNNVMITLGVTTKSIHQSCEWNPLGAAPAEYETRFLPLAFSRNITRSYFEEKMLVGKVMLVGKGSGQDL